MPDWLAIVVLAAQAALTIVAVEQFRTRVFALVNRLEHPRLILDVWGPLALIVPMLFLAGRVDGSVQGAGWVAVGAPVICGLIGLGAALAVAGAAPGALSLASTPHLVAAWTGAGLVLLLLGGAHDLTLWMGQCAFALAAVLLWIGTPDEAPLVDQELTSEQVTIGVGMSIVLACAIGQGAAGLLVPLPYLKISGAMMVAGAAISLAAAARAAGPTAAFRVGGWAATYGVLLCLGLLSLLRLVPAVWTAARTGKAGAMHRVAFGFEAYWIEGLALMLLAGGAWCCCQAPGRLRRGLGLLIIAAAAFLAAWRLAAIG